MATRRHLQLLHRPGRPPGDDGFKLTVASRDGAGLCRVWLRRSDPWERYLGPQVSSDTWDVRCSIRTDCAFAVVPEFTLEGLETLEERFAFPKQPPGIETLKLNGDPVHDYVVRWAWRVTETPEPGAAVAPAVASKGADGWDEVEEVALRVTGQHATVASSES